MNRLEDRLILNRYLLDLLGAGNFEELKGLLKLVDEGPGDDGQSNFYGRLVTQPNLKLDPDKLAEYDRRVMEYERRLAATRAEFQGLRYFQYLALLFTDIFLDRLTENPNDLLLELNTFLENLRQNGPELAGFPVFEPNDLRRMAFFMATGSGKTLLFHVNVWQIQHYLRHGRYPQALVRRADGRREFDNVLLITPNEGLSAQHIEELQTSFVSAGLFIEDPSGQNGLFGPKVKVIEIHKLTEEPSKDGVSVVLEELGTSNLVFVDEGHKGTGSEAKVWKTRQQRLSTNGFLVEYSATFAQAIGGAGRRARETLLGEYGKAILFDYSYAHFYGDGYGKNFNVLNLSRARESQAHDLLMGGLLTFYNQMNRFRKNQAVYRLYNIEKPLWVLLGSRVNAMFTRDGRRRSDVAEVVAYLKRYIENKDWAVKSIARILEGNSGFIDSETGLDLFGSHIQELKRRKPERLYDSILKDVFHGKGALEIWELKNADGELGLRVSTGSGTESPYFGIINIGDVSSFKKHLNEHFGITVQEDRFAASQFERVNRPNSTTNILIGAKKFIEGWSSWRVSSMGLLNVGRGEGSQVIQLFGRGVRLKGKNMSLKRTDAMPDSSPEEKKRNERLETLYIFGWNADYIRAFRDMLEKEDIGKDFLITVKHKKPWPKNELPIPQKKAGFEPVALTWTLVAEEPGVTLDLTPRVTGIAGTGQKTHQTAGQTAGITEVAFKEANYFNLINIDKLYNALIAYKQTRGYFNFYIPRKTVSAVLSNFCKVWMPASDLKVPEYVQEAAAQLLKKYLDRFVRRKERQAEFNNAEPGWLEPDERVTHAYQVRVKPSRFLGQIESLLKKPLAEAEQAEPLPRFYVDWHLFNPILAEGKAEWKKSVSVRPPALTKSEVGLIKDLQSFWKTNCQNPPFNQYKAYLLRNLPKSGIGLFHRSGFYPDFILWLKNLKTGAKHVRFLEPHGLHHYGFAGSADKFDALTLLKQFEEKDEFKAKMITLDGFLLTDTPVEQIPDAEGREWSVLEKEYPILQQHGDYCRSLFAIP